MNQPFFCVCYLGHRHKKGQLLNSFHTEGSNTGGAVKHGMPAFPT